MIRTLIAAALLASTPLTAHAQAAASDPAALAKARELMAVMHTDDLITKSLDAQAGVMTKGLADQLSSSGLVPGEAANDPEFRAILQKYLDRISVEVNVKVKSVLPQIVERITLIYAGNFTAPQLQDVIAFYRTPTGMAFLAKSPAVSAQAAAISRDLAMGPAIETMKTIVPQMQAELKAWADKHPQAAGAKP